MDDLTMLLVRLLSFALLSPFCLGLLCGLGALYAVGSGWPRLAADGLGVCWAALWLFAAWRLVRSR